MIPSQELLEIKARLIRGAAAARAIASSPDPVFYEAEEYEAVYAALVSMSGDISRVMAELDVLRLMFAEKLGLFFMEAESNVSDGRGDVGAVPQQANEPSGEGERTLDEGAGGGVPESRPARKRATRSQPRRNRKSDGGAAEPVGSANGEGEVDRGAQG